MLAILFIVFACILYFVSFFVFFKESKHPQGTTMGTDMLCNTLGIVGSILLAIGFGFLKFFHWGWCVLIGIISYLLYFLLRFKAIR